jgi:hypothetical protein
MNTAQLRTSGVGHDRGSASAREVIAKHNAEDRSVHILERQIIHRQLSRRLASPHLRQTVIFRQMNSMRQTVIYRQTSRRQVSSQLSRTVVFRQMSRRQVRSRLRQTVIFRQMSRRLVSLHSERHDICIRRDD